MPLLAKLDENDAYQLLTLAGVNLIQEYIEAVGKDQIQEELFPVFERLSSAHLAEILMLKSKKGSTLLNACGERTMIPVMAKNLDAKDIHHIYEADKNGSSPLCTTFEDDGKLVLEVFMTDMDSKKIVELLNVRLLSDISKLKPESKTRILDTILEKLDNNQLATLFHSEYKATTASPLVINLHIFKPVNQTEPEQDFFIKLLDTLYIKLGKVEFAKVITCGINPELSLNREGQLSDYKKIRKWFREHPLV